MGWGLFRHDARNKRGSPPTELGWRGYEFAPDEYLAGIFTYKNAWVPWLEGGSKRRDDMISAFAAYPEAKWKLDRLLALENTLIQAKMAAAVRASSISMQRNAVRTDQASAKR